MGTALLRDLDDEAYERFKARMLQDRRETGLRQARRGSARIATPLQSGGLWGFAVCLFLILATA
jgi:hypothetical protein